MESSKRTLKQLVWVACIAGYWGCTTSYIADDFLSDSEKDSAEVDSATASNEEDSATFDSAESDTGSDLATPSRLYPGPCEMDADLTADGSVEETTSYEYDEAFNVVRTNYEDHRYNIVTVTDNTYDENGNLLSRVVRSGDPDIWVSISEKQYLSDGRQILNRSGSYTKGAWDSQEEVPDWDYVEEWSYDAKGNLELHTITDSRDKTAISHVADRTSNTYDDAGLPVETSIDYSDDGIVEEVHQFSYNENGLLALDSYQSYGGAVTGTVSYTYDDAGRLLSSRSETTNAASGMTYSTSETTSYTYDDAGLLMEEHVSGSSSGISSSAHTSSSTCIYNHGVLSKCSSSSNDGCAGGVQQSNTGYDDTGKILFYIMSYSGMGSGVVAQTYVYDSFGNLLEVDDCTADYNAFLQAGTVSCLEIKGREVYSYGCF